MKRHCVLVELELGTVTDECEVSREDVWATLEVIDLSLCEITPIQSIMYDVDTNLPVQIVSLEDDEQEAELEVEFEDYDV